MSNLVLIRHGQSQWNQKNLFTGWTDIDLSEQGIQEAKKAGQSLKEKGFHFDCAYTSVLKRAIRTLWLVLDEMDLMWIPVTKTWYLNERHYGDLQGKNKKEVAKQYGEEQVKQWRRGFTTKPPDVTEQTLSQKIYKNIKTTGESLKETQDRLIPYWKENILTQLKQEKSVLIVAHGNSLRALIKQIENLSNEEIPSLDIPTGQPIYYSMNSEGKILKTKK